MDKVVTLAEAADRYATARPGKRPKRKFSVATMKAAIMAKELAGREVSGSWFTTHEDVARWLRGLKPESAQ